MIPRIAFPAPVDDATARFLSALGAAGFEGDIEARAADRLVQSTDNSIYQLLPSAVVYPRNAEDMARLMRLSGTEAGEGVRFAARGGGTGTNGQSLTDGIIVDVSRHMNRILEIDVEQRRVRVQPGVVKDQLNAALRPHGLFFAPELSTSNRATIGGMISTDASGQGSCLYGKTRHHVRAVDLVLADGTIWTAKPLDDKTLESVRGRDDLVGAIHRTVDDLHSANKALIDEIFPPLNRNLTGYDLAHLRNEAGEFDLTALICGSEGTLGFIAEAELAVLPIPRHSALVAIRYRDLDTALRDGQALMQVKPASIEVVDGRVLGLARGDIGWERIAAFFPGDTEQPAGAALLVEVLGDTTEAIEAELARLGEMLAAPVAGRLGHAVARRAEDVAAIWTMRKRAVGLLGNVEGGSAPVPFVEDTAVPPEQLADYITAFRALLDRHGLTYGMFGHVDAGVLHVRPALDLTTPEHRRLIREITDEVAALTRRHGGVLWGEHGKGLRSEYVPAYFGALYPVMQQIKALFDPRNQFNPGKIASPDATPLRRVDQVPMRGAREEAIDPAVRGGFNRAFNCNGNGACFDFDADAVMCPSFKATGDRRHSPKGRATLMREWLRLADEAGVDLSAKPAGFWKRLAGLPVRIVNTLCGRSDFSHEVHEAMDGCLGCKACAGTCPIKVDVPGFRTRFLAFYHSRYLRRPADVLVGQVEKLLPVAARMPALYNLVVGTAVGRRAMSAAGLTSLPTMPRLSLGAELARLGVERASPETLLALTDSERAHSVVFVSDAFLDCFQPDVVVDAITVAQRLGKRVWLGPMLGNGKPQHVVGDLAGFERTARRTAARLNEIAATGVPLVGIDPAMTLVYRDEYRKALGTGLAPRVLLVQEWLAGELGALQVLRATTRPATYQFLPHCSERSGAADAVRLWSQVFEAIGSSVATPSAGCCGMAGTFGHEQRHRAISEKIYGLSWKRRVGDRAPGIELMASGFSCRSQVEAIDGIRLRHPVSALAALLEETGSGNRSDGRKSSREIA